MKIPPNVGYANKKKIALSVQQHNPKVSEYRGAAHKSCNLKLKIQPGKTKIPVVFHTLKGYDSHHIMQKIHKAKGNITCIPNNAEKYISFSVEQLKFLDSYQFMASSLKRLVDACCATDKADLKIRKSEFGAKTDLVLRKDVYPYEYIESQSKFRETQLPSIDKC